MPLLDIAISQPCSCFRNNILAFRPEIVPRKKLVVGNDSRLVLASTFSRRNFCIGGKVGEDFTLGMARAWRSRLRIKAVGTIELASVPRKSGGVTRLQNVLMMDVDSNSTDYEVPQPSSEDSLNVDERERLRRMRISKANKGNTPWNKGRKHSPETLRRIKERTRLAMQNPKVKAKLVNLGHAQTEETRLKIATGVRLGWEKRREKLKVQETCYYDWQNLIAETARNGLLGEEKLEWDSYKILDEQLEQQWLQSVEERKNMPRIKGSKRAPKSAEQKRKISEAIAAKWADPEYRNRVYSGLAKYHGMADGSEWKPKRKPAGDKQTQKRSPKTKGGSDYLVKRETKSQSQHIRSKRRATPSFKDPLASTKLEMLKNIRAQRSNVNDRKAEAITKAKLLIVEAKKAAKTLEIAAKTSPLAHLSLMESRMLIADAFQLIESIKIEEKEDENENENDNDLSENPIEPALNLEEEMYADYLNLELRKPEKVNGVHSISASLEETDSFSFDEFVFADFMNGNGSSPLEAQETWQQIHQTSPNGFASSVDHKPNPNGISVHTPNSSVNGSVLECRSEIAPKKQPNTIKKWVRGRLVEVAEEEEEEEEEA